MADEFTKAALYGIKTFNKKVKEKIGIEKLIELLNEYEKEKNPKTEYKWFSSYYKPLCYGFKVPFQGWHDNGEDYSEEIATSKQYGFIKWLVENDKIDFELDRIIHKHKGIDFNTGKGIAVEKLCDKYESLLMILAIKDEPIRFLCEIIK